VDGKEVDIVSIDDSFVNLASGKIVEIPLLLEEEHTSYL
jgi:hypothetical protein